MDRLTRAQTRQLQATIGRHLGYLNRLQARLKEVGMTDKRLVSEVAKARNAINDLWVTLHYLSCESGVGERTEAPRD